MRRILPAAFYNPLSLIGSVIAGFNVGLIIFLLIINLSSSSPSPYADLIILFILPLFVLIGVFFIVFGILRYRKRRKAGLPAQRLIVLDFNDGKQRTIVLLVSVGFIILSLIYAFAMYQGYQFVESDYFCGQTCHSVMGPEDTAHSVSYHENVQCSTCHVGSGTNYFILSKLRGVKMLAELIRGDYAKPVPVPLTDLRPSEQICGACHSYKFQRSQPQEERTFYLSDENNTPWMVEIIFKVSGEGVSAGSNSWMHWHSAVASEIDYAAPDAGQEKIPWIRAVALDGMETIYYEQDSTSKEQAPAGSQIIHMDCNDCHNRTGHEFNPADWMLNRLLETGMIDSSLPEIKKIAIEALDGDYSTQDEGVTAVSTTIDDFYKVNYPEVYSSQNVQIQDAINTLMEAYKQNYDPDMDASWRSFPDNTGHMYTQGCFRCHDGNHVNDKGEVLSKDCNLCHLLAQRSQTEGGSGVSLNEAQYPHPVDIGSAYKDQDCSACHGPG